MKYHELSMRTKKYLAYGTRGPFLKEVAFSLTLCP